MTTYSLQENKTLCNSSPVTNSVQIPVPVIPFKVPIKRIHNKTPNQRFILPKLVPISPNPVNSSPEALVIRSSSKYPKLTPPRYKTPKHFPLDTELTKQEGSLLKPPILTTRPTILKPFIVSSNDVGLHSSNSVTGPVINVPNI
ncbi:unnamed protein product, partial [Oppiella nova]